MLGDGGEERLTVGERKLKVGGRTTSNKANHRSQSFVKKEIVKEDATSAVPEGESGASAPNAVKGREPKALVRGKRPSPSSKDPEESNPIGASDESKWTHNLDDPKTERPRRSHRKMIMSPHSRKSMKEDKSFLSPQVALQHHASESKGETEKRLTPRNSSLGATLGDHVTKMSLRGDEGKGGVTSEGGSVVQVKSDGEIGAKVEKDVKMSASEGAFPMKKKDVISPRLAMERVKEEEKGREGEREEGEKRGGDGTHAETVKITVVTPRKSRGKRRNTGERGEREMKRDIRVSGGGDKEREGEPESKRGDSIEEKGMKKDSPIDLIAHTSSLPHDVIEEEEGDDEDRAVENLVLHVAGGRGKRRERGSERGKERERDPEEPTMEQIRSRRNDPGRKSLLLPLQDSASTFYRRFGHTQPDQ